jgi:hypothetical protein
MSNLLDNLRMPKLLHLIPNNRASDILSDGTRQLSRLPAALPLRRKLIQIVLVEQGRVYQDTSSLIGLNHPKVG